MLYGLGCFSKFFLSSKGVKSEYNTLSELLNSENLDLEIDTTAVAQILNYNFAFGDRTILKGVNLTPWMSSLGSNKQDWDFLDLPPHQTKKIELKDVVELLYNLLLKEMATYVSDNRTVGILLSGGMDSRIVAVVLKHLQKELSLKVVAITWGEDGCRDVVYSKKIAEIYGWEYKHIELTEQHLISNVLLAAEKGCLYSPLHLHAMSEVASISNIDCIIAGSFGDGIGRGEYSGKHITELDSLAYSGINKFALLKAEVNNLAIKETKLDIDIYRERFPRVDEYSFYELERQIHYLRKQLNQCMAVINEKVPLYQMFSTPEVFGFIWSLSPEIRNDHIYNKFILSYGKELVEIPWSRTGKPFLEDSKVPDLYKKDFHSYGEWVRDGLRPVIKKKIFSGNLQSLNIFNNFSLYLLYYSSRLLKGRLTRIDEQLMWLATLSDFIALHKITGEGGKFSFGDFFRSIFIAPIHISYVLIKNFFSEKK